MVDIEASTDILAKWCAKQPDPVRAGAAVLQLLYSAAQIKQEGRLDQKVEFAVRAQSLRFAQADFLTDLERFNQQTSETMGWT